MFSAPEQRRDWAQRGLLGAVLTQRNTVHFQGYPGLLWCSFPSSSLFPVKNLPGEIYTHSIENWDLVPTALPQQTPCWYGDEIPPEKQLQRESFIKAKFSYLHHLSKPLGCFFFFFCWTFPVLSHLSLCGSLQRWLCCVQGQVLPPSAFCCTSAPWV